MRGPRVRSGAWARAVLVCTFAVSPAAWAEGPPQLVGTPTAADARTSTPARSGVTTSSEARPRARPEPTEPPELTRLRETERELLARAEDDQARRAERLRARQAELLVRREELRDELRRRASAPLLPAEQADRAYEVTRQRLRAARDALALALEARSAPPPAAASLEGLTAWPDDPLYAELQARRAQLESAEQELHADEAAVLEASAALLLEELDALNTERLALLPRLTPARRHALTGWGAEGRDQARAELHHLALVLRDHHAVARAWLGALGRAGTAALAPERLLWSGLPWLALAVVFAALRRHSGALLTDAVRRRASLDALERRAAPSGTLRALQLLAGCHRTLEVMALAWAASALLPERVERLLEVQLLATVVTWTLGASLAVSVVNTLTAQGHAARGAEHDELGGLRLRSLRLVGRVVVALGLAQVLVARLVGEGTIHAWVTSLWPWAAGVVVLLLVHAWRSVVFERVDRARRRSPLHAWVSSHRTGSASLAAATLGGLYLFARGVARAVRRYLASFELGRRAHAYLFRRELARLGDGDATRARTPLAEDARVALDPERPATPWVASPADDVWATISARVSRGQGGLLAVVGPRGAGKSSLLARLATEHPRAIAWTCPRDTIPAPVDAPLVLVDDAQQLIKPAVGGLAAFDALVAEARASTTHATWVLALDATLWPFLSRARDVRPTFDEILHLAPWSEESLDALLVSRSEAAGLELTYEDLLERLPADADELETQDALAARRAGYVRMLWDHVGGNPGLALDAWRASLACGPSGRVHVRPLQVPDPSELEGLPDSTLFVLRAVLQLGPAAEADVAEVTRLGADAVHGALCFGEARGYVALRDGRVHVTWRWLSALVRHLQRRHLLVSP